MRKMLFYGLISFLFLCSSYVVMADNTIINVIDQYGESWSDKKTDEFAKSIFGGLYRDISIATPSLKGSYEFTIINQTNDSLEIELIDAFTYTDLCPVEFWLDDPENTNVDHNPQYFDLEVGESSNFADALEMTNYLDGKGDVFKEYTNDHGEQVRFYQFSDVFTMKAKENRNFILNYEWSLATADLIQSYLKRLTVDLKVLASSSSNQLEDDLKSGSSTNLDSEDRSKNDLKSGILPSTGEIISFLLILLGLFLAIYSLKQLKRNKKI